jgi:hypothetical protein
MTKTNAKQERFMREFFWQIFTESGSIDAFLAYKQCNNDDKVVYKTDKRD